MISEASNILLAYLDEDNSILVAAFISLFNTDSTATDPEEIERELKKPKNPIVHKIAVLWMTSKRHTVSGHGVL